MKQLTVLAPLVPHGRREVTVRPAGIDLLNRRTRHRRVKILGLRHSGGLQSAR
jgi:hypothetical protein